MQPVCDLKVKYQYANKLSFPFHYFTCIHSMIHWAISTENLKKISSSNSNKHKAWKTVQLWNKTLIFISLRKSTQIERIYIKHIACDATFSSLRLEFHIDILLFFMGIIKLYPPQHKFSSACLLEVKKVAVDETQNAWTVPNLYHIYVYTYIY